MQSPRQAAKLAEFLSCAEWSFQKLLTNLVLNHEIDKTLVHNYTSTEKGRTGCRGRWLRGTLQSRNGCRRQSRCDSGSWSEKRFASELSCPKKQLITFKGQTLKPSVWLKKGESDMGREQRSRPERDAVCFVALGRGVTSMTSRATWVVMVPKLRLWSHLY